MRSADETLVRWGLHLLDFSDQYCPVHSNNTTQDDEAIARSLQEQLYSLEDPYVCSDCANEPEIGDYFDQKPVLNSSETASGATGAGSSNSLPAATSAPVSRTPSPPPAAATRATQAETQMSSSRSYADNENDEAIAVVLSEEFARLDGEVGRRLNHMESIPHVPRINREIPSADDASLDHERLLERLQVYGLTEHKISGDGNCQFRALSDQYYRTPDHHMFVRKEIVKQLKQTPERYQGYVPMDYSDYVKKMARSGEWGDHVTLQAAADVYGLKICLITSFRDTCIIDIGPQEPKSERVIFLSFWAEVHYNSVYPEGGIVLW